MNASLWLMGHKAGSFPCKPTEPNLKRKPDTTVGNECVELRSAVVLSGTAAYARRTLCWSSLQVWTPRATGHSGACDFTPNHHPALSAAATLLPPRLATDMTSIEQDAL